MDKTLQSIQDGKKTWLDKEHKTKQAMIFWLVGQDKLAQDKGKHRLYTHTVKQETHKGKGRVTRQKEGLRDG